jgi:hypothetical protein
MTGCSRGDKCPRVGHGGAPEACVTRLFLFVSLAACNGDKDNTQTGETGDTGPETVTDRFKQELVTPLDILWVLDSGWGGGMDALQDSEIVQSLHETVLTADPSWRMGVIAANASGGAFGMIGAKWDTYPPPNNAFAAPPSSSDPRVRDAIYTALELRKEQMSNADFLRADGHLYVIVVTDGEDASQELPQADFDQWFSSFEGPVTRRMGAITTSDRKDYWEGKAHDGEVVDVGSFRQAFDKVLRDAMGQQTAFTLSHTPIEPPATITMVYRENETELTLNEDYTYDPGSRLITLEELIPPPTSEIVVTYEPGEEEAPEGDDDDG